MPIRTLNALELEEHIRQTYHEYSLANHDARRLLPLNAVRDEDIILYGRMLERGWRLRALVSDAERCGPYTHPKDLMIEYDDAGLSEMRAKPRREQSSSLQLHVENLLDLLGCFACPLGVS